MSRDPVEADPGLRDKMIHDYLGVTVEIVWGVVKKGLPNLRPAIDNLLSAW